MNFFDKAQVSTQEGSPINQSSIHTLEFSSKRQARFAYRVMRHLEKHPDKLYQRRARVEKAGKVFSCPQFKDRRGKVVHKCGYCWTGNIRDGWCKVCGAKEYAPKFHSARRFP